MDGVRLWNTVDSNEDLNYQSVAERFVTTYFGM